MSAEGQAAARSDFCAFVSIDRGAAEESDEDSSQASIPSGKFNRACSPNSSRAASSYACAAAISSSNAFMAGYFLVLSFFKLLDLRGFADADRSYDVVSRRLPAWR